MVINGSHQNFDLKDICKFFLPQLTDKLEWLLMTACKEKK